MHDDYYTYSDGLLAGIAIDIEDCTFSGNNVYNTSIKASWGQLAGIVNSTRNTSISNCSIYDSEIWVENESDYDNHISGIVGYFMVTSDTTVYNLSSCTVKADITETDDPDKSAKFIAGYESYSLLTQNVLNNCTYDSSISAPDNDINIYDIGTTHLKLGRFGLNGTYYITVYNANTDTNKIVTLTSSNTLSDLCSMVRISNNTDVWTSGNNGTFKLKLRQQNGGYIAGMDNALASLLKLSVGEGYTYSVNAVNSHTNTNSSQQYERSVTTLSSSNSTSLSMADLGLASNGTITTNNYVITVNTTDMMSEVLTKLSNAGITATINDANGTLQLIGSAENYIKSASNNIKSLLGLTTGNGYTYNTNTITTRTDSNSKAQTYQEKYTIQQIATENTQLGKINSATNFAAGNLVFNTEDGNKVINLTSSDTIKSLRKKLSQNGITTDFTGGKLTISGDKGAVSIGEGSTSNFASFAGLNYDSTLDNFAVSDNLTSLADDISEKNANKTHEITIMAGINGGNEDMITIDTSLKLGRFSFDVTTDESSRENLDKIDTILNTVMTKQTEYASATNRLESASESILTYMENLTSSLSTLRDADIAKESSNYIKAQILQQASATLLATANQSPSIALQLI